MRGVVLLNTHFFNSFIERVFEKLTEEVSPEHDVFIVLNCGKGPQRVPEAAKHLASRIFLCNNASLTSLPYPAKCSGTDWSLNPGHADLLPLLFFASHPEYDFYWGIEYDVHFDGKWSFLIDHFNESQADLITTTIYWARDTPHKKLIPPFRAPSDRELPETNRIRAFLPIYRVSSRALKLFDDAYRKGGGGHHELTWCTIAHHAGLSIEDFGGNGKFVKPQNVNRFYFNTLTTVTLSPGTFVYRPAFARLPLRNRNILWHPIKPPNLRHWAAQGLRPSRLQHAYRHVRLVAFRAVIGLWFLARWRPLGARAAPDESQRILANSLKDS